MISITGYGLITGLGNSILENLDGLKGKKNAFQKPKYLNTKHRDLPIFEVKMSNEELKLKLSIPENKIINRTTLLALIAIKEALSYLPEHIRNDKKIAFINATTVSGMTDVEDKYFEFISDQQSGTFMNYISSSECVDCTDEISKYFDFQGFKLTISTACSSSSNAVLLASKLIQTGEADIVICGGTDAISKFTLNGFNSLRNVSSSPNIPFDEHRDGLNLGEGAAYLILESKNSVQKRNGKTLAFLKGYANTNEGYHPTAPAPNGEGALRTMKEALENANLNPQDIDFISTHGTATLGNDLSEGKAIERLFSDEQIYPPFSSIKSYIGHTLASSGAASAIFSCLFLNSGFLPANLRFKNQMKELNIKPLEEHAYPNRINYILSNSFGFGGNNVVLVLAKSSLNLS